MMKKEMILLIAVMLLLVTNASASFLAGNKTFEIDTSYAPNEKIKGWINISLQQEASDSLISSNFNGSIKLKDFLEANSMRLGEDYFCTPLECEKDYLATNGERSKSFSLDYGEEKIISFLLTGNLKSISSLSFDVSATNDKTCMNPLKIDILDDKTMDWKAGNFRDDLSCVYNTGKGCFTAENLSEVIIAGQTSNGERMPFCERIGLLESGKFLLGAWVKKGETSWREGLLRMELYNLANEKLASCNLPLPSLSGEEISCQVSYKNEKTQEYYVCIVASSDTDYRIRTESIKPCGFYSIPGEQTEEHDYDIFARSAKFESIGNFVFNQQEYESQGSSGSLANYILSYIDERYEKNCTPNCIVPITFKSLGNLKINITNLNIGYSTGVGFQSETKIYETNMRGSRINSEFLKLDLKNANLSVLDGYGNRTFILHLGNEDVFSKEINIIKKPIIKSIYPRSVSAAVETRFIASLSHENKIASYMWDFGDGIQEETSVNSTTHAYPNIGSYVLKLSVKDEDGLEAIKEFIIIAGNPKDVVNITLKKYRRRIENITKDIEGYPEWYKKDLKKETDIENLDSQLRELERKYVIANSEENYVSIMSNLSEMRVPVSLRKSSKTNDIPIIVNGKDISLEDLEKLGAGNKPDKEEEYKKAIESWNSNLGLKADFFTLSIYYDNQIKQILNYYKLKIEPDRKENIENYLVVNGQAIINSADAEELDNGAGIKFDSLEKREVEFVVLGEINPIQVPLYMSPEFKKLAISKTGECNYDGKCEKAKGENWKNCRNDCKPYWVAVIYLSILFFVAFITYVILQEWYKRRYENYLFKNRNDLYNLVNFINNALIRGINKGEIERSLKRYGWNSEQITYAFKKVKGKKTGMPIEISLKFPKPSGR